MEAATGPFPRPEGAHPGDASDRARISALVLGAVGVRRAGRCRNGARRDGESLPHILHGPSTYLQASTGQAPSYTVPSGGGVITSWSTLVPAGAAAQAKLGVFRPTGPPPERTPRRRQPVQTLKAGSLNSFPTSIPVQAGDTLGLLIVAGELNCIIIDTGSPEDRSEREEGPCLTSAPSTPTTTRPSQPGGST